MVALRVCLTALAAAALAGTVAAQSSLATEAAQPLTFGTQGQPGNALYFTLFGGAQWRPGYFGADENDTVPAFRGSIEGVRLMGRGFGSGVFPDDPNAMRPGFSVSPSFRFISGRSSDDYDELQGLDDVDPTLELGIGLNYGTPILELFADARYGFGGSEAWVGELGADFVARPSDRLALRIGPRVLYGSEEFNETYFGVTADEAAASGLNAFDAESGLVSTGVEFSATYRLNDRWWLEGSASYERFDDDLTDSPIIEQGSEEQTSVRIGFRRAFALEF